MTYKNAQGTIEYLLIIGIVVVIALVLAVVLLGFNNGDGISNNTSNVQVMIGNLSITQKAADFSGNAPFALKNNGQDITLKRIDLQ